MTSDKFPAANTIYNTTAATADNNTTDDTIVINIIYLTSVV